MASTPIVREPRDTRGVLSLLSDAASGVAVAQGLSYVPQLHAGLGGLVFPTRQAVELSAAMLPHVVATADPRPKGVKETYGVRITPGTVRVRRTVVADDRRDLDPDANRPTMDAEAIDAAMGAAARAYVRAHDAGRRAMWRYEQLRWAGRTERRRVIGEWSAKSRMRMVETLASLDWTPIVEPGEGMRPAMVTLTLPGDWTTIAPTGAEFKALMRRFWARWDRSPWGPFRGVWKLEFQRRGAPHVHIYASIPFGGLYAIKRPTDPSERRRLSRVQYATFIDWLSWTWFDLCASAAIDNGGTPDPRQYRAGTGVDWGEGMRAADPKRLAVYFAGRAIGHNVKGKDKEYQHRVPREWRADGCGRFWGYKRLEKVAVEVELERGQFVNLKRLMRATVKARGLRVPRSMTSSRGGAVLLANDGPAWLGQAARDWRVADLEQLDWRYRAGRLVNIATGEVNERRASNDGQTGTLGDLRGAAGGLSADDQLERRALVERHAGGCRGCARDRHDRDTDPAGP